ncbi:MAG: metalloregulator ArsR/SmtB family transcription factor [Cyanobacteria bacterium J06641_5]
MLATPTTSEDTTALFLAGFRALSDPIRLQVLETLRQGEMCVCDLCDRLEVSQSKLSFHLRTLRDAALVSGRQEGRWVYYSLNLSQLVQLEQYLSDYRRHTVFVAASNCCPTDEPKPTVD